MYLISREKQLVLNKPPKVSQATFLGVGWGGTVVAFFFLVGRLGVRLHTHRTLYFDDFFVTAAWFMLLANAIIWQFVADYLFEEVEVAVGKRPPTSALPSHTHEYLRMSVAVLILFYTGLWFVKFSFLVFFRRLGSRVKSQTLHWWFVTVLTVTTWIVTFGLFQYKCQLSPFDWVVANCGSESYVRFQWATLIANMVMDVITDAAIITIPVHLLWNVRINLKTKLALLGIFSLTVFIIIVAIVRVTLIIGYTDVPDVSWLYMWNSVEQSVSIIIASLASFRALFMKQNADDRLRPQSFGRWSCPGFGSTKSSLRKFFSTSSSGREHSKTAKTSSDEYTDIPAATRSSTTVQGSEDSMTQKSVSNGIQVSYQVTSAYQPREKQRQEIWEENRPSDGSWT